MEFTKEEAKAALPVRESIGGPKGGFGKGAAWRGNPNGSPKVPDTLREMLIQLLTPSVRRKLGQNLIDLALNGSQDRIRLEATREIYDRIEGRPRLQPDDADKGQSPIIQILTQVMTEHNRGITEGEVIRVLESGTVTANSTSNSP